MDTEEHRAAFDFFKNICVDTRLTLWQPFAAKSGLNIGCDYYRSIAPNQAGNQQILGAINKSSAAAPQ